MQIGQLYERPETTDPGAYHSPAVLPAGGVRSAGAPNDAGKRPVASGAGDTEAALLSCTNQVLACIQRRDVQRPSEGYPCARRLVMYSRR